MNKLSKRLEVVSGYIQDNTKIIDIGCDHGLLSIYLAKKYEKTQNQILLNYYVQRIYWIEKPLIQLLYLQ